jgi:hypothetical protein
MGPPRSFIKDKIAEAGAAAIWNRLTIYDVRTVAAYLKKGRRYCGRNCRRYAAALFWWRVLKYESSGGNYP